MTQTASTGGLTFTQGPSIDPNTGTLTYRATPNANGKIVFRGLHATSGGPYTLQVDFLDLTGFVHFTTSGRLA